MTHPAGKRLGHYEILSPLGAGGMGEVYRARDLRLDRVVAVKVLPDDVAAQPDRLRRFTREARAASALNHPSILAVYEVGTEGSVAYIAMEYVDGQTLREVMRAGALPIKKVLEIAGAVADGLASAHEAGIVHRDVKPDNVMVSKDGFVKVLDFGLAKMGASPGGDISTDSTMDSGPGTVMGTVSYMSPEQAAGALVDYRSDQFSFGSLLYEMLTGRRAFRGETEVDTLAAILRQEAEPIGQVNPAVPAPLRWIVERCHAKAAADRYNSTRDLARDLQGLKDHLSEITSERAPVPEPRRRLPRLGPMLVIGLAVVAGAGLWNLLSGRGGRVVEPDFRRLTLREGAVYRALFVPQSNSILYTASWDGRPAGSYLTLHESKGMDRSLEAEAQLPMAYSEDGSEVLVLIGRSRPAINVFGTLAWWPSLGGKPRLIAQDVGWSDWGNRGHLLAVVRQQGPERTLELWDSRGVLQRTLFRTMGAVSYVRISPDEKTVAFIHHPSRNDDAGEVRVVDVEGAVPSVAVSPRFERCVGLDWNPRTGEIWFTATTENIYKTTLWATNRAGKVRAVYSLPDFFVLQDVSETECLFVSSSGGTNLVLRGGDGLARDYSWLGYSVVFDVSPDGKSVLFLDGGATEQSYGTWVRPLDGGDAVRIANGDPGKFSPDGRWVVTTSRPVSGPPQLAIVPSGGGSERPITTSSTATHSDASFVDADTLLFVRSEGGRSEVWRMATDGTQARALGGPGCVAPAADPVGRSFLCLGGPQRNALFTYPLEKGPGRKLFELSGGVWFLYARWNDPGTQIFAVTSDRRFLTVDAVKGAILRTDPIPLPEASSGEALRAAACSRDGRIQAYSVSHYSSRLYLCRGL